jgi:hypothetical protein
VVGPERYQLVDCVVEGASWTLWRGRDSVLHRDVGIVVVAADHPRRGAVADAAQRASLVTDTRFLHVYDVIEAGDGPGAQGDLWLVREWASGANLVERLGSGTMRVEEACALGIQVAQALSAAQALGVVHGAVGPADVLLTDDGRTKLVGLATRAALDLDGEPGGDGQDGARDSWAAAAVTFAAVTGRWPGGERDGLPGTPAGAAASHPARVRGGLPRVFDSAVADAVSRPPHDPAEVAQALTGVLSVVGRRAGDTGADRPSRLSSGPGRALAAGVAAVLLVAAIAGATWLGLQLARDSSADRTGTSPTQSQSTRPTPTTGPDLSTRVPVTAGKDFDPDGNGQEEPELVPLAFDGNLATAWHTVSYEQADLAPKSGVGVVFDLGRVQTVGAVRLNLLGAGTSLQVRVSRSPGKAVDDFEVFGSGTGLGDLVALRAPEPVQARYVLVWLTRLPAEGENFRGGIAEIQVARS